MRIKGVELVDSLDQGDPDDEVVLASTPRGSGPVRIDIDAGEYGECEAWVVFTAGPLEGHVAVTDFELARLVARSWDELVDVLNDPANIDEDEETLVDFTKLIDAFADGTRTPDDQARGRALLDDLADFDGDEWNGDYCTQAEWAAKLMLDSESAAKDAIAAAEGHGNESTPVRWAGEAAEEYLADLERWRSSKG